MCFFLSWDALVITAWHIKMVILSYCIQGSLTSSVTLDGYTGASTLVLDDIEVLGVSESVNTVTINGEVFQDWVFDENVGVSTCISIFIYNSLVRHSLIVKDFSRYII